MLDSSLHSAKTLSAPVKSALEELLGRPLAESETISVKTYKTDSAAPEQRAEAITRIQGFYDRLGDGMSSLSEVEQEELMEEAMRTVRPGYKSIK